MTKNNMGYNTFHLVWCIIGNHYHLQNQKHRTHHTAPPLTPLPLHHNHHHFYSVFCVDKAAVSLEGRVAERRHAPPCPLCHVIVV